MANWAHQDVTDPLWKGAAKNFHGNVEQASGFSHKLEWMPWAYTFEAGAPAHWKMRINSDEATRKSEEYSDVVAAIEVAMTGR